MIPGYLLIMECSRSPHEGRVKRGRLVQKRTTSPNFASGKATRVGPRAEGLVSKPMPAKVIEPGPVHHGYNDLFSTLLRACVKDDIAVVISLLEAGVGVDEQVVRRET